VCKLPPFTSQEDSQKTLLTPHKPNGRRSVMLILASGPQVVLMLSSFLPKALPDWPVSSMVLAVVLSSRNILPV
jgi:hypothetical protein